MILNKYNLNKSRGYYFGKYNIVTNKYLGVDFSRKCFVFPGQGLAFPGMFKEQYLGFKIIRDKFKEADILAKKLKLQKISDYIINPEELKEETLPVVRNLALFTLEVSLHELLVSKKIIPRIVTGHSFGEYVALVVSGIISFETMFDIIYHRDIFCPKANSLGFMMAINADGNKVKDVLKNTKFYISNLNSQQQTAISVSKSAVSRIKQILGRNKVKYVILSSVPQPYHSPYLNDTKDKIEKYIKNKKISFRKPRIPVFSSVTQKIINKSNFNEKDIRYILTNQIISPVNFIYQISSIYSLRYSNFIEIGDKKVFSEFIKNILTGKEVKTDSALNILRAQKKDSSKVLSPKNNKLFSLISKTIGKITGYEIEKISFEDRYQEDLGIDSIKKAEILLTVLDESNIRPGEDFNTSGFESIKDTVAYLENADGAKGLKNKAYIKKETHFNRYVSSWIKKPLEDCLFESVKKHKSILIDIEDIQKNKQSSLNKIELFLKKGSGRQNIIIFSDYSGFKFEDISPNDFKNSIVPEMISFFKFFRKLLKGLKRDDFNLILASQGEIHPYISGYASFFKSVKKELPEVFFKHIHFDKIRDKESVLNFIEKEMLDSGGVDVLYKNSERFVSVLKPVKEEKKKINLNKKSVIIALGGAKGITFSLIKNISQRFKPVIYLVGKSLKENEIIKANIKELMKHNLKIYYESLDATDINSLDKLFSRIKKKHKKINLVINGVGVVKINFLKDKTDKDINYEFKNKIFPAFNILNLSLKYEPERIINFSSVISNYGSAGQSIYTCVNEMINRITMEYNSAQKNMDSFALTIHWPPWDGVGMTQQQGVLQKLREYGTSLLKPNRADELFLSDAISSKLESVYYLDESDLLFYSFALNNIQKYNALIGKMANPFGISVSSPIFEKIFDLSKDTYLKDHQIKGVSYVPAAVGISMFLCLANMYNREFPILENIVIYNPIIVQDKPVKCQLKAEKRGAFYDFSIMSNVLCFSCMARNNREKKTIRRVINKAKKEILVNSIYSDYYSKDSLYHGPILQCIDRALLDKDDNPFFRIDNSKLLPVLNCGIYDKLIQWMDVSFQALGAIGLKYDRKFIPVKVSKLTTFFHNKISNYLYIIPSITQPDQKTAKGNVVVVNEDGEIIIEMKGVFLRTISKYDKNKLKIVKYRSSVK